MQVTTIGLDIAKNVFQVHGIDAAEKVVVRKQLRRSQVLEFFKALPPCLIGMEACATAHYWARELTKLGHKVRLMPARDVKAYVKRNKNDAADAEAICESQGIVREMFSLKSNQMIEGSVCIGLRASCRVCARPLSGAHDDRRATSVGWPDYSSPRSAALRSCVVLLKI
jgi:transposase